MKDLTDTQKIDVYTKLGVFCVAQEVSLMGTNERKAAQHVVLIIKTTRYCMSHRNNV